MQFLVATRHPVLTRWHPIALIEGYRTAKTIAWNLAKADPEKVYLLTPCFNSYEEWENTPRREGSESFTGTMQHVPAERIATDVCAGCSRQTMPQSLANGLCIECARAQEQSKFWDGVKSQ